MLETNKESFKMQSFKLRVALSDRTNLMQIQQEILNKMTKQIKNQQIKTQKQNIQFIKENQNIQNHKKIKLKLRNTFEKKLSKNQKENSYAIQKINLEVRKVKNLQKQNLQNNKYQVNKQKLKKDSKNILFHPPLVQFILKSTKNQGQIINKKNTGQIIAGEQKSLRNSNNKKQVKYNICQSQKLNQNQKKNRFYKMSKFLGQISCVLLKIYSFLYLESNIDLDDLISCQLNYQILFQILHNLFMTNHLSQNFYNIQSEEDKEQLKKVYCLWKILKNNSLSSNQKFNVINLTLTLLNIVNIEIESFNIFLSTLLLKINQLIQKRKQPELRSKTSNEIQPKHIFFIKNKILITKYQTIIQHDKQFLHPSTKVQFQLYKEFEIFRINRLKYCKKIHNKGLNVELNNIQSTHFQFSSLISPKSQQLAITKRLKILKQLQAENLEINVQQSDIESLSIFLNYKQPNKCQIKHNEQTKKNITTNIYLSKNKKNPINSNLYIPSKKMKFSQLKSVMNMQKARKLKLQKQIIIQKGWTNNGQIFSTLSRQGSVRSLSSHHNKQDNQKFVNVNIKEGQYLCTDIQRKKNNIKQKINNKIKYFVNNSRKGVGKSLQENKNQVKEFCFKNQKQAQIIYFQTSHNLVQNKILQKKIKQLNLQKQRNYQIQAQISVEQSFKNRTNQSQEQQWKHDCTLSINSNDSLNLQENQIQFISSNDHKNLNDFLFEEGISQKCQQHQLIQFQHQLPFNQYHQSVSNKEEKNIQKQNTSVDSKYEKEGKLFQENQNQKQKCKTFKTEQIIEEQFDETQESINHVSSSMVSDLQFNKNRKSQQRVIKSYLKIPILYVDVNMDENKKQRIIIFEQDNPQDLANQFGKKHMLDLIMIERLQCMLTQQINGILGRIDEEQQEYDETKEEIITEGKQDSELQYTQEQ